MAVQSVKDEYGREMKVITPDVEDKIENEDLLLSGVDRAKEILKEKSRPETPKLSPGDKKIFLKDYKEFGKRQKLVNKKKYY